MTHPTHSRVAAGNKMQALGVLLTALLVMALSAASAGAATAPGKAFAWGHDEEGQLGNGASGPGAQSSLPVGVENLTNVRNVDGGDYFTLATTH